MMEACHERLHRMLVLLTRLREHLPAHGADEQAQQAARDAMKYFDQAAPQHHRDEELHVFPPVEGGPQGDMVRKLRSDHEQMESQWADVRALLGRIARGEQHVLSAQDASALDAFATLYQSHIADEERIAYPAARALLDAPALQAMGQEMSQRRGGPR